MVYDTGFFESKELPHKCGRVLDHCVYNDIKIFFCIFCRKVITAKREADIEISISLNTDVEMNEYDQENLKEWI